MKLCPKCQKQFSDDANFCPVDAARLSPIETQAAGGDSLAARFDLGPRIGGNRTGAVHRATDKTTKAPVIVKLVAPTVVALPGVAQRLERELRQLERVQSAGVARVLASGKRGDETWVAMEVLDGAHSLAEAITARGPIAIEQAADLIEVIGEALIEAAQVGVVHRDLAPKNVLFAGQDVKLINFSLPVPTTEKVPGVAEFVAPEQVDGRPVDQRSNLYSLGALYYFVLTGQTVFAGAPDEVYRKHQSGGIRPPSQLSGIAAGSPIETVIMRALDRSPTKRFLTVRQFVDEVARVGRGEVIELKATIPQGSRAPRPKAELVSTLMGVRHNKADASKPVAAAPPIASAPTVGTGVPSVAAPVVAASAPVSKPANVMQSTMIGVSSGAHGAPQTPQLSPKGIGSPDGSLAQAQPMSAAPMSPKRIGSPDGSLAQAQPMPQPMQPMPAQMMAAQIVPDSGPVANSQNSPWAPPAPQAPVVAAPVIAAPTVATPAAPVVAGAAHGKQKAPEIAGTKGKFRETMWFKKGDLDTQAAIAAADERARTGKDVAADKVDTLPMDERYKDDGSISRGDKEKYSLRTGATHMMQALRADSPATSGSQKVSEDALIDEMKGGRSRVLIIIAVAVVALVLLILLVSR